MGYIYKIENKLNGKKYIGQTVKPLEKRFSQHRNNYTKPYFAQLVLYKAFNKYGIDNFSFEEVEEIPNDMLDEREKYWISYYNSYYDGYNSTLGGRATQLYEWDEDEVIEAYHKLVENGSIDEIKMKNLRNVLYGLGIGEDNENTIKYISPYSDEIML